MAVCRSCGAPVRWAMFRESRKLNPLNAAADPKGNLGIVRGQTHHDGTPLVVVVTAANAGDVGNERYTSHFATCANAAQHRRAK